MFRFASVKRLNRPTFTVAGMTYTRAQGGYVVFLVIVEKGPNETLTVLSKAQDLANSKVLRCQCQT